MHRSLLLLTLIAVALAISACAESAGTPIVPPTVASPVPASASPTAPSDPSPTPSATPTTRPITAIPTATPTLVPASPFSFVPPGSIDVLQAWLANEWQAGRSLDDVMDILEATGWAERTRRVFWFDDPVSNQPRGATALDLDGDGRDEWIVAVYTGMTDDDCWGRQRVRAGELWVIGAQGVVLRLHATEGRHGNVVIPPAVPPVPVLAADLTGDGRLELVTEHIVCGAHTPTAHYHVLSGHGGWIRNIVQDNALHTDSAHLRQAMFYGIDAEQWSLPAIQAISPSLPEIRPHDGKTDLVIRVGIFGSIGAGPRRSFTDTYSWDGSGLVLVDVSPSLSRWAGPQVFRVHVLYDANFAFVRSDLAQARQGYLRVLQDENLADKWERYDLRPDTLQFAAFRLALLGIMADDLGEAQRWATWLKTTYPDGGPTAAAATVLNSWNSQSDIRRVCESVTAMLSTRKGAESWQRPTGMLADAGYSNPNLKATDLCPVYALPLPQQPQR